MGFPKPSDGRPVVYWADDDDHFVDANMYALSEVGFSITHFGDATTAHSMLGDRSQLVRGVVALDVMLLPGIDKKLFCATADIEEEQMGLLLLQRMKDLWFKPSLFPLLVYSGRAQGDFKQKVEKFCARSGVPFLVKSSELSASKFANEIKKLYDAFAWGGA